MRKNTSKSKNETRRLTLNKTTLRNIRGGGDFDVQVGYASKATPILYTGAR